MVIDFYIPYHLFLYYFLTLDNIRIGKAKEQMVTEWPKSEPNHGSGSL